MIEQLAELGRYFLRQEGVVSDSPEQAAEDPSQKYGSTVVLLLISADGLQDLEVTEYRTEDRLRYLFRTGPPNKFDATPTTGLPSFNQLQEAANKRLNRLAESIRAAMAESKDCVPVWERSALKSMCDTLVNPDVRNRIVAMLGKRLTRRDKGIITVVWVDDRKKKFVGDFVSFRHQVVKVAQQRATTNRQQCAMCGSKGVSVGKPPGLWRPPLYTTDKPGSIPGGFNPQLAWRNWPTCNHCYTQIDFARERVKKYLNRQYYDFRFLILPLPLTSGAEHIYDLLNLEGMGKNVTVDSNVSKALLSAEDDISYKLSNQANQVQFDFLFYQPDRQTFRPALYVSGLLPSRFAELFQAKEQLEVHPWCRPPSPDCFCRDFTFEELSDVFRDEREEFLAATRNALEKRRTAVRTVLASGMRGVREDFWSAGSWQNLVARIFRTLLFFDFLVGSTGESNNMVVDYGQSPQAARVRELLRNAHGKLKDDPAAQAAFLIGACCGRIETIQAKDRGLRALSSNAPFSGKLKGFNLNERDVRILFREAKSKAAAYGEEAERTVGELLKCAAAAFFASPEPWDLSPDEVSYFVALGHTLKSRLAEKTEVDSSSSA